MFGEYQSIMIFYKRLIKVAHCKNKIKLSYDLHKIYMPYIQLVTLP
jgi:hypothetical protein